MRVPRSVIKPSIGELSYRGWLTQSPIWHGLAGGWFLNEGGGTRIYGVWGRNGTLTNGPVWADRGVRFDGSDDYSSFADTSSLYQSYDAISVYALVSIQTFGAFKAIVSKFWDGTSRSWLLETGSTPEFRFRCSTNSQHDNDAATFSTGLSTNTWYSVLGQWSSAGTIRIWVNGVEGTSQAQAGATVRTNNSNLWFGANEYGGAPRDYVAATIRCVYIWNRFLSPSEIRQLHINPFPVPERRVWLPGVGGVTVNVDFTLGKQAGITDAGEAQALASVSLGRQAGITDSGLAQALASASLARQAGITDAGLAQALSTTSLGKLVSIQVDGGTIIPVDFSLGIGQAIALQGGKRVQVDFSLGTIREIITDRSAIIPVTFTLARADTLSASAIAQASGAIVVGRGASMGAAGTADALGAFTLPVTLELTTDGASITVSARATWKLVTEIKEYWKLDIEAKEYWKLTIRVK